MHGVEVAWRTALASVAIFLAATSPSRATATLTCDIKDAAFQLSLQGAVGNLSTLASVQGRMELKGGKNWPLYGFDLDIESILQQWIDALDLRLRIGGPPEHSMLIELTIITTKKGEFGFAGQYRLTVTDAGKSQKRSGRVSCTLG